VQVGEVVARAEGLNSPYKSHQAVEFCPASSEDTGAVLAAWNDRYHVQIGGEPPDPHPVYGYVGEFVRLSVPISFVEPLFPLARRLGLSPRQLAATEGLVDVYVLTPSLAGWHYSRPVFWATSAQNDTNAPAVIEGEPVITQGGLEVVPPPEVLRGDFPTWNPWAGHRPWFYNHVPADTGEVSVPEESVEYAAPVAVLYNGFPRAAVRLDGPVRIVARDHDPVEVGEGGYIAIHRFPNSARGSID